MYFDIIFHKASNPEDYRKSNIVHHPIGVGSTGSAQKLFVEGAVSYTTGDDEEASNHSKNDKTTPSPRESRGRPEH